MLSLINAALPGLGVGVVIRTPGHPGSIRLTDVFRKALVLLARVVRAKARADDGVFHTGVFQCGEVYTAIELRNVHAFDSHAHSSFLGSV